MSWLIKLFKPNIFETTSRWLKKQNICHLAMPETSSTNEIAKAEAFSINESFKVYLCDQQTAGRGRGTNTWTNPRPGQALMATFSFKVDLAPQPITAPLAGLAVYKALHETWPDAKFALKAPNDILLTAKKICGILVETVQMGQQHRLIIGVGLNVLNAPVGFNASHLSSGMSIGHKSWKLFLKKLIMHLHWIAQGSQTAHISDSERVALLQALNNNPNLPKHYVSLSPFGDLVTETETLSWRNL